MPRKAREKIIFFVFAILILLVDFISKRLALDNMHLGQSIPVVNGIFHITLVINSGTAFGLFKNLSYFFTLFSSLAVIIVTYIIFFSSKNLPRPYYLALSLILAGATGNLIDRIKFGNVIDFLDFRIWPVFNFADTAITIGVILLIFQMLFDKHRVESSK